MSQTYITFRTVDPDGELVRWVFENSEALQRFWKDNQLPNDDTLCYDIFLNGVHIVPDKDNPTITMKELLMCIGIVARPMPAPDPTRVELDELGNVFCDVSKHTQILADNVKQLRDFVCENYDKAVANMKDDAATEDTTLHFSKDEINKPIHHFGKSWYRPLDNRFMGLPEGFLDDGPLDDGFN
jgi:hypothetical protein